MNIIIFVFSNSYVVYYGPNVEHQIHVKIYPEVVWNVLFFVEHTEKPVLSNLSGYGYS